MSGSGAGARALRRGPAPIASFDHDGSDESSPETKQAPRLPEIREDGAGAALGPPAEPRARSHSTPAATAGAALPAPRIDISRASSSSHHDSRDSSPELALFAGASAGDDARARLELGFREDGALELRSSTEELAFLEGAPGPPARPAPAARRHSRKDSQGSEAALLAVSGRTSRISSVGSQCSALSAPGRVSRLSAASGAERSPSPHRMLLETSFCGPKPIETDPEICAAAVEERLLEIAKLSATSPPELASEPEPPPPVDARDRREVRTEVTVECAAPAPRPAPAPPEPPPQPEPAPPSTPDGDKRLKETQNQVRAQERRARPRVRREPSEPEVYKTRNRSKDIIRIKLKPDDQYEEDDDAEVPQPTDADTIQETAFVSATLEPVGRGPRVDRPTELVGSTGADTGPGAGRSRDSRTPSPSGAPVSRKSSFCSLFKSRETIASPDSPSGALLRKRSLTESRSRSKSRDRSATPSSGGKLRGSVLSLFRTPRRSAGAASPPGGSREGSPALHPLRTAPAELPRRQERLKYYEDSGDIIHIPLRTPPDERPASSGVRVETEPERAAEPIVHRESSRPASAPHCRSAPEPLPARAASTVPKPVHRTVLPDGSIIIPLHSPTERVPDARIPSPSSVGAAISGSMSSSASVGSEPVAPIPTTDAIAEPSSAVPERSADSEHAEPVADAEDGRRRRKERIVFTTHVGSREQVFSTQFSVTKTPSVASEISGSFPSFVDCEDGRDVGAGEGAGGGAGEGTERAAGARRDSSGSEPSSDATPARGGSDAERRGLVVQDSFEEELPYVPTTLPQERSLALPMVPVRERGAGAAGRGRGAAVARPRGVAVARPRGAAPAPPPPAPPSATRPPPPTAPRAAPAPAEKLRIRLPRRPRTASGTAPARPDRVRTGSGGDGGETRPKTDWIDFEEVPERRKQPKRIQTLPATASAGEAGGAGGAAGAGGAVFSYVEPEHCRCECHAHAHAPRSTSSLEEGEGEVGAGPGAGPGAGAELPPQLPRAPRGRGADAEPRH